MSTVAFHVVEGRLVPLLLNVDHAERARIDEEDMVLTPNLRRAVMAANRRLMAVTHGLADPGDDNEAELEGRAHP